MFGWKSKAEQREEIIAQLRQEDKERQEREAQRVLEAKEAAAEMLKAEQSAREEAEKAFRESDEPWVDIKAIVHDPEKGVKIELDWNDAFVIYLKQNGYTGVNDESIIQKYIITLTRDIVESMDGEKESEFE